MQLMMLCCMCFISFGTFAQNGITIRGQVVDAKSNEPLIGVSIQEKGTTNGIITDFEGNYRLNVGKNSTIVFSYVGYQTKEVKASAASTIIKLNEDSEVLDEVVVVGYGTQKKVNLSGAVSSIGGEAIASKPATDVLTALQGEML